MDWLVAKCRDDGAPHRLHPPATESCFLQCEQRLGLGIPPSYRRLLAQCDGGVLFHQGEIASSGLHLFGCSTGLDQQTEEFRLIYPEILDLLTVGYTPGAGAFYLAMEPQGAIIDLFGSPYREPTDASAFPYYRGEWRMIAPDIESLLTRMFSNQSDPFYWFTIR